MAAVELTEDRAGVGDLLAQLFGVPPEVALESPLALVGNATQMTESLEQRRRRWGYNYPVIPGLKARELGPVVAALTGS
jgi:hypothetical protein